MATIAQARNEVVFSAGRLPIKVTGMQSMAGKMWIPIHRHGFHDRGDLVHHRAGQLRRRGRLLHRLQSGPRGGGTRFGPGHPEGVYRVDQGLAGPSFKFLGLGMLLGGVTFLLATILGALRVGGGRVQEALGVEVKVIKPPVTAQAVPNVDDDGDDDPDGSPWRSA